MYYLIRILTVACFFSLLGKAALWLSPLANSILVLGYRSFIIFTPLISKLTKIHTISISLFLCMVGVVLFFLPNNQFMILGAAFCAAGISVSNFFIKTNTAHEPKGAALNKISANIGSFFAALILLNTLIKKNSFFELELVVFAIVFVLSFFIKNKEALVLQFPKIITKGQASRWSLYGIATGIKLFAIFSVLPQYLIHNLGNLPYWYGILIFINSLSIIIFQWPIIHFIRRFNTVNQNKLTVFLMMLGMIIIAIPSIFLVGHLLGAILWIFALSLIECAASYLDIESTQSGYLLIKEIATGIGGAAAVLMSRYLPITYASIMIGLVGIITLTVAYTISLSEYKNLR